MDGWEIESSSPTSFKIRRCIKCFLFYIRLQNEALIRIFSICWSEAIQSFEGVWQPSTHQQNDIWMSFRWWVDCGRFRCLLGKAITKHDKDIEFIALIYPHCMIMANKWAVTCDFQQCVILTSVGSNKHVQPPFKLTHSKWCSVGRLRAIEYSSSDQTAHMHRLISVL